MTNFENKAGLLGLVDERKAEDIFYQDSSKAFDTASQKIFMKELLIQGMDEQ